MLKVFPVDIEKFLEQPFLYNASGGFLQRLKDINFFCKKSSMVIAGLGAKYASAHDTSFSWKDFSE